MVKPFGRLAVLGMVALVSACQSDLSALKLPTPALFNPQTQSFNDAQFEMKSCEITPERSAICKLTVTNRYRDKRIEVGRGIKIQDNHGTDYAVTAGGFGDPSSRPQWNQVAVADSDYQLTVIATNLSTRAEAVRAVIFPRLLVRSTQGQTIGYRDQVIFSKPAMIASVDNAPSTTPAAAPQKTTNAGSLGNSSAATHKLDGWQVVGYWNYDAADGKYLAAQGLVLRGVPGNGLGQKWPAHLELKNHTALSPRDRSLWPVKINSAQRKVCANYPGYPSYQSFVDMPGEAEDGVYQFAQCSGE